MKYSRIYKALKIKGFSPAKALEIIVDAKRGQWYAMNFVRVMFWNRHN